MPGRGTGLWLGLALSGTILLTGQASAQPAVTIVGSYSNMVYTGGQAQGFTVHLWREGDLYFGFLLRAEGLASDIPLGLLESLRVTRDTQTISFKARVSVGVVTVSGEDWVPSRDVYQFQGTLFPDQIAGEMIHADLLNPNRPATHESVKLYRSEKDEEDFLRQAPATTYKEWTGWAEGILQARGPKW